MARFLTPNEGFPLEVQLKTLGDEELLDFWEETQYLERFLTQDGTEETGFDQEYERLILQELMVRSCKRPAGRT